MTAQGILKWEGEGEARTKKPGRKLKKYIRFLETVLRSLWLGHCPLLLPNRSLKCFLEDLQPRGLG